MGKPRWKRILAVGCSHGDRASLPHLKQVLDFKRKFKPHIIVHLGDYLDTATFRRGAAGTKDECADIELDSRAGLDFLEELEPNVITEGNHDARIVDFLDDPKAIVRYAANELRRQIIKCVTKLKAKLTPYELHANWVRIGGHFWGHGFWHNVSALRDSAEFCGGPVVQAHLHRPAMLAGRTLTPSQSFCVGYLGEWSKFGYAHRRRASAEWGHGVVFGEVSDTESQLWLASSANGKPIAFPPGM